MCMEKERHEAMSEIQEFFTKNDRFAAHADIELLEVSAGRAKASMRVGEKHLNGVGGAHGGAIFTLADLVFAAASNSHGTVAVAINASISYLKGVVAGTLLTAEAEENSLHPKLGSYTIHVTDDAGDLVAVFQGIVYRKRDPLPVDPDA